MIENRFGLYMCEKCHKDFPTKIRKQKPKPGSSLKARAYRKPKHSILTFIID